MLVPTFDTLMGDSLCESMWVVRNQINKPILLSSLDMGMPQTVAFLSDCKQ